MARKFSYPEIADLLPDECCTVIAPLGEVRRKVVAYAKRNKKSFEVIRDTQTEVLVTRLPDPEPEVA